MRSESPQQSVATWSRQPIRAVSKFAEQINDADRKWPAQFQHAAEFCTGEVRYEQGFRTDIEWTWRGAHTIQPDAVKLARSEFARHQTDWRRSIAWWGAELKVNQPDFLKLVGHQISPRNLRRTM